MIRIRPCHVHRTSSLPVLLAFRLEGHQPARQRHLPNEGQLHALKSLFLILLVEINILH